jgi:S1-C subfamily serine protease
MDGSASRVWRSRGHVVTNHHLIGRARSISIELAGGRKPEAELLSSPIPD